MRVSDAIAITVVSATAMGWAAAGAVRPPSATCRAGAEGTALIPAGIVRMGEDGPGRPGEPIEVAAFRIDRTEVTNRQFAQFVRATSYVTEAERQGTATVFVPPQTLQRGLEDAGQWWRMVEGASWRHPRGPDTTIEGHDEDPVVQVTYADAAAYAAWRGGMLPSESQWERAARGTRAAPPQAVGWTVDEKGRPAANIWNGIFPLANTEEDGFAGVAPVGCFDPNGFGLFDMIGNVWEWTSGAPNRPGPLRGGSYLCAGNYCANYRPVGRQEQEGDLATSHAGFRLVYPMPRA